ncbi:MAG TPA: winged helix-turn-helix domain-containing protein [Gemmatimonadaceae bacterium]|nr:winged helix-turn-helix domain-containing protein [Gemmatimonadaceae bacterium]
MNSGAHAAVPPRVGSGYTTLVLMVADSDVPRCLNLLSRAGFDAAPTAAIGMVGHGMFTTHSTTELPIRYRFGDVELDLRSHVVRRSGVPVRLTPVEFDILATLLRRKGEVVKKRELHRAGWTGRSGGVNRRVLAMHILNLRQKLEPEPSRPRHILTVWGIGYRLVD